MTTANQKDSATDRRLAEAYELTEQQRQIFAQTIHFCDDHVFIQPFCDYFQIDYTFQLKAISRSPLLKRSTSKKTSMLLFGDERERIALTKEGFITWILQLRGQIVHPNLREKLLQYQMLIFDWMFGAVRQREHALEQYKRLAKLKRLYGIIGAEIQRVNKDLNKGIASVLEPQKQYTLPLGKEAGNE